MGAGALFCQPQLPEWGYKGIRDGIQVGGGGEREKTEGRGNKGEQQREERREEREPRDGRRD